MRFESFKLGAKCWLQSLNQCLSPHPWPACWSMTLQNPDTTGHTYIQETRHDRTYLHTRNHISDQKWFSFVCKVRVSSVASLEHVVKKKKVSHEILVREFCPVSSQGVQCWSDSREVLEVRSKPSASAPSCPAAGLFPGAARAHGGREPRTGSVLQSCSNCCLSHTSCLSSG